MYSYFSTLVTDPQIIGYLDHQYSKYSPIPCTFNSKHHHVCQGFCFSRHDNLDTNRTWFFSCISYRGVGNCAGESMGTISGPSIDDLLRLPNGKQVCKSQFGVDFSKPTDKRIRIENHQGQWFYEFY